MYKEILLGIILASLIYGLYIGINVTPAVAFLTFIALGFFLIRHRVGGEFFRLKNKCGVMNISFEQIGGQSAAKTELLEALQFIVESEKLSKLGIRPLKGILLSGPPGTGKTLLAKAAADFTNSAFISCSGSDFVEVYAGVGAQRIRQIFQRAKRESSTGGKNGAIIFIDEIDVLGGKRGSHQSHMEYDQTLNQLLVEMDGIDSYDNKILIMAATNRVEILDEALTRPGRFDRIVHVTLPDINGRLEILKIHAQNKPLGNDVDLKGIAKECFGFSGAHLESVVNEAAILAFRDKVNTISQSHFLEAIDKVIMGEKVDRKPDKNTLRRVAIHEIGHALLSETLINGSVSGITISPRGNALGYVRQIPENDQYIYTLDQLENQIAISIAGAVSEKVILGDKSTGSKDDFTRATGLAREIIFSGLSSLGIVDKESISTEKINTEIYNIIKKVENIVENIITDNREKILILTDILLEKERINGNEFRLMLKNST